ncbi:MAG: hypothetical protein WBG86_14775 [Polyangiales bacterium]
MSGDQDQYETPARPTLWLALGFAILIALGVVTVLMPEVEDEAIEESATSQESDDTYDDNEKAPPE